MYLKNTRTDSSFIESIIISLDSNLSLFESNSEYRKNSMENYLSVLDKDMIIRSFWRFPPENKSEMKRQIYI